MRGVMKKSISSELRSTALRLKRLPSTGRLPRPGVRFCVSLSRSFSTPPTTVVPPSGTSTSVDMRCVSMPGVPSEFVSVRLMLLFSIVTWSMTVPASVICGVTERRSGTETKVVVKTDDAPPADCCGVTTGSCEPDSICAGRLLSAVTRGVAMIFACPFDSAAVMSALICAVPKMPVVSPMTVFGAVAPSWPTGWLVLASPPGRPNLESGPTPAVIVPLARMVLNEPSAPSPLLTATAESWTPRSREKFRLAMTMRVSISTCGSGWSSSWTRRRMASMFSFTSVTMRVFERPSTSMPPRRERRRAMMGSIPWSPPEPVASPPEPPLNVVGVFPPAKSAVEPAAPASVPAARA